MKYINQIILLFSLFIPCFSHTMSDNDKGLPDLDTVIGELAEGLYCDAELTGGENYKQIINEHVEKFKTCLQKKGTPINYQSQDGVGPLMRAAYFHQWEIMELLIQKGADPTLTSHGHTALELVKLRKKKQDCAKLDQQRGLNLLGLFEYIGNLVMQGYYTEQRYNKCMSLLQQKIQV